MKQINSRSFDVNKKTAMNKEIDFITMLQYNMPVESWKYSM